MIIIKSGTIEERFYKLKGVLFSDKATAEDKDSVRLQIIGMGEKAVPFLLNELWQCSPKNKKVFLNILENIKGVGLDNDEWKKYKPNPAREKNKSHYLTLGELRNFIDNTGDLPDHAGVFYQRIEDVYFEEHNWKTVDFFSPEYPDNRDEFIGAFSIYTGEKDEKTYVLITAHY